LKEIFFRPREDRSKKDYAEGITQTLWGYESETCPPNTTSKHIHERSKTMNYLKRTVQNGIVVGLVIATTATVQAQTFYESPGAVQGFVQQGQVIQQAPAQVLQQPTEEQLKQLRIGANLYDTGTSPAVRSVFTNGPAQKAGLQSGDLITKINGEASTSVAEFNAKLATMSAGDTFQLTRSRSGEESDITVSVMTLGDVLQASIVPEPGMFDSAIGQLETRVTSIKQQIKNTQQDLDDLNKNLAREEQQLSELKAKAETSAAEVKMMEAKKMEEKAMEAKKMEAKKMEGSAKKMEGAGNGGWLWQKVIVA